MLRDKRQILVIDDELNFRRVLAGHLALDGYEVHEAEDVASGVAYLHEHYIDVVLTDLRMGDDGAGMEVLRASRDDDPSRPVVMITGNATVASAVEAMKLGAFDYLAKPVDAGELRVLVAKAIRTRELKSKAATSDASLLAVRDGRVRFGILSRSAAMLEVFTMIERVADTPSTVLITGETGTGKELVAQALHAQSGRRDQQFIAINCAAIPKDLVEDELFGHERGAFTGAVATRPGRFEIASGGTLFLDEIGEMPIEMQAKLLRVLQERKVARIGQGQKDPRPIDVRVIAASARIDCQKYQRLTSSARRLNARSTGRMRFGTAMARAMVAQTSVVEVRMSLTARPPSRCSQAPRIPWSRISARAAIGNGRGQGRTTSPA
jgi:two-component system response regulator AtoC